MNIEHIVEIDIDLSPVLPDVVGSLSDVSVQGDVRKVLRKTQERTTKSHSLCSTYIHPACVNQTKVSWGSLGLTDIVEIDKRFEDVGIGETVKR